MVTDVFRLLLHVAALFDHLGIRYVVGGSLASGIHGEVRATNDIDVLCEIPDGQVEDLIAALKPTFDVWEDSVRKAVAARQSFSALHVEWHVKVDFFPAGSLLDESQLDRRQPVKLPAAPDKEIFVSSAEDIVLRKLQWFRQSEGVLDRQLRDVVGVLKLRRGELDLEYLDRWARESSVMDLLEKCRRDAGLRS